jgi:hypothetical protein
MEARVVIVMSMIIHTSGLNFISFYSRTNLLLQLIDSCLFRGLYPEDGGNMALRNVGTVPNHYALLESRRPRCEFSSREKLQVSILGSFNDVFSTFFIM